MGDVQPGRAGNCRAGDGRPGPTNNGLFYLHNDHLGSTSAMSSSSGPNAITDRGFTGQKENMELGLYYYNARYYVPYLNRFISADSIMPDPANPQSFNRYSYTFNNPLKFTDPSGHCAEFGDDACWSAYDRLYAYVQDDPDRFLWEGSAWSQEGVWDEMGTRSQENLEEIYDTLARPYYPDYSDMQPNCNYQCKAGDFVGQSAKTLDIALDIIELSTGANLIPGSWTLPAIGQIVDDRYESIHLDERLSRAAVASAEGWAVDTISIKAGTAVGVKTLAVTWELSPPVALLASVATTGATYAGIQIIGDVSSNWLNENIFFPTIHGISEFIHQ